MSKLVNDSELYKKLSDMYDENKETGNINLEFFNECVDKALDYNKREIKYVIFTLKLLNEDSDTASDIANGILKAAKAIVGDSYKASFIIAVLETTLDEKPWTEEVIVDKLGYKISEEYSHELNDIGNKLDQLERGRIYELSGAQMDGYLSTNVSQLRKMINDLLNKIQTGKEGIATELGNIMKNLK